MADASEQLNRLRSAVGRRVRRRATSSEAEPAPPSSESVVHESAQSPDHFFDPNPTIAIVVPAHNEDRFIRPCLRSIREQWFNSWECVIVDDGSSDGTRSIADEFAAKDSRFRVVSHTESLGLATARNTGIELTKAPYLTFLDADDFLYQHSLNARLKAIRESEQSWVADSYCDWQPTRENQGRTPPTREVAQKPPVVGFPQGPECPFIATAPLVRRDVVEDLGGFNEALPTAEDFDLWIRILRAGYSFVFAPRIGVAYRQKASGMVFRDTALHARASDAIIASQYEDLSETDNPPPFAKPLPAYALDMARARRLLRSYALSSVAASPEDRAQIGAMLPDTLPLLSRSGLDVRFELNAGLGRAARAIASLNDKEVKRRTLDELEAAVLAGPDQSEVPTVGWTAGQTGTLFTSDRAQKRSFAPIIEPEAVTRPEAKSQHPMSDGSLGVLLVPMARYHALEMLTLAAALAELGQNSTFLVIEKFEEQFADVLEAADRVDYTTPEELPTFDAAYMMNDWGVTREIILEARKRGASTFARVEGVQDYRDVDTGRIRLPYQTADHILAQGRNDVDALNHTSVSIVGNARLEKLWGADERSSLSASGKTVINSNFTYGVFTEIRNTFVEMAIRGSLDAGMQPVISQHPADRPLPAHLQHYRSEQSMSDLLHECDVLISRFSTVPFEAMAVGTPFIYLRPAVENVDTFDEPDDAYRIVNSSLELAEALPDVAAQLGGYRAVSEKFFRQQIDITGVPSDVRTASMIVETVRGGVATAVS